MDRKIYVLGSGRPKKREPNTVYVDIKPHNGVDFVIDLEKTPWEYPNGEQFPDGCALHVNATHVIEHIGNFCGFMDECWRILNPGGSLLFEVPVVQINPKAVAIAFSDPTHVNFFTKHTFINYLTVEGVDKHGIVEHAWCPVHLEELGGGILRGHLIPVPDEYRTRESIQMWKDYKENHSHA